MLLDIYLPDLPGTAVLLQVRARQPEVDLIVLSAAREPATIDALRARLAGYAARREMLTQENTLRQHEIDSLFSTGGPPPASAPLPKGLSRETARLVASLLDTADPDLSSDECAHALGLSRVAARSYLEYFVSRDLAGVQLRYGHAGRPQRRYRWKEAGQHR
ncbi:Transcriptional regulatory protein CitT [Clavibacter michiganensis]|uniref:Transcriptional regulatory protein CitT n=1 Tax=Clavibacter michiganensis TaxID=28447 RepID=A0A251XX58_9MICO|nr:Transcriptional regulatory protein CitT [Clavibacter michiganensis]